MLRLSAEMNAEHDHQDLMQHLDEATYLLCVACGRIVGEPVTDGLCCADRSAVKCSSHTLVL